MDTFVMLIKIMIVLASSTHTTQLVYVKETIFI